MHTLYNYINIFLYIILHTLYIYHKAEIRHDLTHMVLYNINNDSSVMETNNYNVVHDARLHDNPPPDIWKKYVTFPPPPPIKNKMHARRCE